MTQQAVAPWCSNHALPERCLAVAISLARHIRCPVQHLTYIPATAVQGEVATNLQTNMMESCEPFVLDEGYTPHCCRSENLAQSARLVASVEYQMSMQSCGSLTSSSASLTLSMKTKHCSCASVSLPMISSSRPDRLGVRFSFSGVTPGHDNEVGNHTKR